MTYRLHCFSWAPPYEVLPGERICPSGEWRAP